MLLAIALCKSGRNEIMRSQIFLTALLWTPTPVYATKSTDTSISDRLCKCARTLAHSCRVVSAFHHPYLCFKRASNMW